jgi:hypothetical protein
MATEECRVFSLEQFKQKKQHDLLVAATERAVQFGSVRKVDTSKDCDEQSINITASAKRVRQVMMQNLGSPQFCLGMVVLGLGLDLVFNRGREMEDRKAVLEELARQGVIEVPVIDESFGNSKIEAEFETPDKPAPKKRRRTKRGRR